MALPGSYRVDLRKEGSKRVLSVDIKDPNAWEAAIAAALTIADAPGDIHIEAETSRW